MKRLAALLVAAFACASLISPATAAIETPDGRGHVHLLSHHDHEHGSHSDHHRSASAAHGPETVETVDSHDGSAAPAGDDDPASADHAHAPSPLATTAQIQVFAEVVVDRARHPLVSDRGSPSRSHAPPDRPPHAPVLLT